MTSEYCLQCTLRWPDWKAHQMPWAYKKIGISSFFRSRSREHLWNRTGVWQRRAQCNTKERKATAMHVCVYCVRMCVGEEEGEQWDFRGIKCLNHYTHKEKNNRCFTRLLWVNVACIQIDTHICFVFFPSYLTFLWSALFSPYCTLAYGNKCITK